MGKYIAIYRCLLCNQLIQYKDPFEWDDANINDLVNRAILNQQMMGNPYLYDFPLWLIHNCYGRDGGMAQLAGFRRVGD